MHPSSHLILSILSLYFIQSHSQLTAPNPDVELEFGIINLKPTSSPTFILKCVNVISTKSGSRDDDEASVSCSDHPEDEVKHYTLVSCGWQTNQNGDGGYMSTDGKSCIAINGNGGSGVFAHGRCCDFREIARVDCRGEVVGAVSGDDRSITGQCDSDYPFLTSCNANNPHHAFDGSYPGIKQPNTITTYPITEFEEYDHECTVRSGSNSVTYGRRTCCKIEPFDVSFGDFQCVLRYSGPSGIIAGCPPDYTMIGCSGWGYYKNLNEMYITSLGYPFLQDSQCVVDRPQTNGAHVYATAICCKFG